MYSGKAGWCTAVWRGLRARRAVHRRPWASSRARWASPHLLAPRLARPLHIPPHAAIVLRAAVAAHAALQRTQRQRMGGLHASAGLSAFSQLSTLCWAVHLCLRFLSKTNPFSQLKQNLHPPPTFQ